ncbi:MAG: signal peptidase I [Clostridia bacterium]|nr:signal peptidase I [Clostridia bacterium]
MSTASARLNNMPSAAQVKREIYRDYRSRWRRRTWKCLLKALCILIVAGLALRWLRFTVYAMQGSGMSDTLLGGDIVLCEHKLPLIEREGIPVAKGQLALIDYNSGTARYTILRRVIATAGDEVFVSTEGRVTINGEALDEPYATYRDIDYNAEPGSGLIPNPFNPFNNNTRRANLDDQWAENAFPITVPDGALFVLADDRETFDDSRSHAFGLVSERDVIGVATAVLWPAYRMTLLKVPELPDIGRLLPLDAILGRSAPQADDTALGLQ